MSEDAWFFWIWFIGLCSGIALTFAWQAVKLERAAPTVGGSNVD